MSRRSRWPRRCGSRRARSRNSVRTVALIRTRQLEPLPGRCIACHSSWHGAACSAIERTTAARSWCALDLAAPASPHTQTLSAKAERLAAEIVARSQQRAHRAAGAAALIDRALYLARAGAGGDVVLRQWRFVDADGSLRDQARPRSGGSGAAGTSLQPLVVEGAVDGDAGADFKRQGNFGEWLGAIDRLALSKARGAARPRSMRCVWVVRRDGRGRACVPTWCGDGGRRIRGG